MDDELPLEVAEKLHVLLLLITPLILYRHLTSYLLSDLGSEGTVGITAKRGVSGSLHRTSHRVTKSLGH